jgi:hypothetical protein
MAGKPKIVPRSRFGKNPPVLITPRSWSAKIPLVSITVRQWDYADLAVLVASSRWGNIRCPPNLSNLTTFLGDRVSHIRWLKPTLFVPLWNFFWGEHCITLCWDAIAEIYHLRYDRQTFSLWTSYKRFLKSNSVLPLVCIWVFFKNQPKIRSMITWEIPHARLTFLEV